MEAIYKWFYSLFGSNLAEHLSGWDEVTGGYTKSNLFSIVGVSTLIITVVICITYYYVLNHPRWNRWWKWLIFLIIVAIINFLLAFGIAYSDLLAGNISSDLLPIFTFDCMGFGLANIILSVAFFIIFSFIIKWGSRNCKYSPF
jgi:membrane-associated HD superfamily phosphohydrolase